MLRSWKPFGFQLQKHAWCEYQIEGSQPRICFCWYESLIVPFCHDLQQLRELEAEVGLERPKLVQHAEAELEQIWVHRARRIGIVEPQIGAPCPGYTPDTGCFVALRERDFGRERPEAELLGLGGFKPYGRVVLHIFRPPVASN